MRDWFPRLSQNSVVGGWILGYLILNVEQIRGLHSMHILREEIVGNNNYKMKKKQKQLCGYVVSLYIIVTQTSFLGLYTV